MVRVAHMLSAAGARLLDPPNARAAGAVSPLLASLTELELGLVCKRAGHVREVLTGYRSGSAEEALAGEPRAAYQAETGLMDRYRAKDRELNVGVTTVRRWVRSFLSWMESRG